MKAIGAENRSTTTWLTSMQLFQELSPNAKRIIAGSHCDSVKNGGNYDGILGVMSAMEAL